MNRAKEFIQKHAEAILREMGNHKSDGDMEDYTKIICYCENFNAVCDAVVYLRMHEDGTLYSPDARHPRREGPHNYMITNE